MRQRTEQKSAVLLSSAISTIPRVRTYHTRKPSRFVHALSARPLKVQGGRGSSTCADETSKITFILLCSHPVPHSNLNREVHRRLIWHSSESESALERFEPVAADKLRLDGSLAMFAPEGDGCLNRARREDAVRIHKAGTTLCDFWYFSSRKSTIKEKLLYDSSRANNVRPLSRRRRPRLLRICVNSPTIAGRRRRRPLQSKIQV